MKTIVITGASSGIGFACMQACLARGYRVIATARQDSDLELIEQQGATAIRLNLLSSTGVERAAGEILELVGGHIDVLLNNAGYGLQVAMEDCDWDALTRQMQVNSIAPVILTNRLLPALGRGSLVVFNSSSLGRFVVPFRGPYSMSKFALEAAADAYRLELKSLGVKVQLIEPGPIEARFRANALVELKACLGDKPTRLDYSQHVERLQAEKLTEGTLPASAVAALFLDMIDGRRSGARYLVTRVAKFGGFMRWLLGSGFDAMALKAQPVKLRN